VIEVFKQATTQSNFRGARSGVVWDSSADMRRHGDEQINDKETGAFLIFV
jgi:hypothetical protein